MSVNRQTRLELGWSDLHTRKYMPGKEKKTKTLHGAERKPDNIQNLKTAAITDGRIPITHEPYPSEILKKNKCSYPHDNRTGKSAFPKLYKHFPPQISFYTPSKTPGARCLLERVDRSALPLARHISFREEPKYNIHYDGCNPQSAEPPSEQERGGAHAVKRVQEEVWRRGRFGVECARVSPDKRAGLGVLPD